MTGYVDSSKPLVIFGMYRPEDYKIFRDHPSEVIIVWQGMDARNLLSSSVEVIKSRPAKHYAISHWIKQSLDNYGIESELFPIHATIDNLECCPRGDSIYFYSSDNLESSLYYYGEMYICEIAHITGLNVIRATASTYTRDELIEVYKKCFINLRLTTYDGCPNTNLEMGLMGRRSVFNGDLPHSIKWDNLYRMCDDITREYETRQNDNSEISADFKEFVNLPNHIFYERTKSISLIP
jgi:hypothetical protein